jgi:DNA-binding Lrp family transcriptional regulator
MAAMLVRSEVAPEFLRLMLLAYGLDNSYRVITLEEIAQSLRQFRRDEIRNELDRLTEEGLLMKFSGRYCFNKAIPNEIRLHIERTITPSGTIRIKS